MLGQADQQHCLGDIQLPLLEHGHDALGQLEDAGVVGDLGLPDPQPFGQAALGEDLAALAVDEFQHRLVGPGLLQRTEVLAAVVLGEHGREALGVAVVADLGGHLGQPGLPGRLQPTMAEDEPVAAVGLGGDDQVLEDADGPDGLRQLADVPDGAAEVVLGWDELVDGQVLDVGGTLGHGAAPCLRHVNGDGLRASGRCGGSRLLGRDSGGGAMTALPCSGGPRWPAGHRPSSAGVPGAGKAARRASPATGVPDRAAAREERTGLAGAGVALRSEDAGRQSI
jgi:hypothetical protein